MSDDHKCANDQFLLCINNAKCHFCDGERLFKKPKYLVLREREQARKAAGIPKKKKEGMDFEKRVAKRINTPKPVATRQPGSGAFWSRPGDIITPDQLIECKERGSTNSRGELQMTIPKSHLEKAREEAVRAGKPDWRYVFGFKNDSRIYVVKDFNDELNMARTIQELLQRVEELEKGQPDVIKS
jgi:hypothetical protein